ncbi:MAG: glycosyltransferase family 9 protein [Acidobacteria bacterium]|nr:glycosyltransferase family 9 protein [Acidobacteriota bacterium]
MKQSSKSPRAEALVDETDDKGHGDIRNVLLVRLRSIGDTVLMTPCLTALRAWRGDLKVSVLLEKTSAPLLHGHPGIDELIVVNRALNQWHDAVERVRLIKRLRKQGYDLAVNLHGGTTSTFLTYATGAALKVGYRDYQYSFLLNRRAPPPDQIWQKPEIHSVEQQLGLLKWLGVPVDPVPQASLHPSEAAKSHLTRRLARAGLRGPFVLMHPAATLEGKRWSSTKFAQVVRHLSNRHGLPTALVAAPHEGHILDAIKGFAGVPTFTFTDLPLQELVAISSMARLFIGNDSGPAHVAAAMRCPTVVVFGASNPIVWRPWGMVPHVIVRTETDPAGHLLDPEQRIHYVAVERVIEAADQLLASTAPEGVPERDRSGTDIRHAR